MPSEKITITAPDGPCPATVFTPAGDGTWPGVLFLMDGMGIRPALLAMAERLASEGFVVLVPDLYNRAGAYGPMVPADIFAAGNFREVLGPLIGTTGNQRAAADAGAFLDTLAGRDDVSGARFGVVGYCLSGGMALTIAATYPGRIAAAASFHGGNLATDAADSPHLLASQIRARVLVVGAEDDQSYPPEMARRLDEALSEAGVDHRCLIYPGTKHGWTMSDFPIYNPAAAERHWTDLVALFTATLTD